MVHTLHLKRERQRRILGGHLWAFAGEIAEDISSLKPGGVVTLCESRGGVLGRGYVNPKSLIAVRLLTRGDEPWDDRLFERRIREAVAYREDVCSGWEAARMVYSEGDDLPGLIVDRYGAHLVVQSLTAGIERRLEEITAALQTVLEPESILLKGDSPFRRLEGLPEGDRQLFGETPLEVAFSEEGARFTAHPHDGQKGGFYLDQRSNRGLTSRYCSGKRVLDLFSYTGAWGIRTLLDGAAEALMVESSESAVRRGLEAASANDVGDRAVFIKADVGEFLDGCVGDGETFDIVILDPPGLVKSRSSLKAGVQAYRALHSKALRVLRRGGLLVSCSCSHLLSREKHLEIIGSAALRKGRRARLVATGGQPPDHPVLPGHPETEYLKCWVVRCE